MDKIINKCYNILLDRWIFVIILMLLTLNCYSQNDNLNLKKETIKKLDLNNFKNLPLDNNHVQSANDTFYMADKEAIRVTTRENRIYIIKQDRNTPYTFYELYSEKTKSLIGEGKNFSDMPIGIWKEYDENGKLIKETDRDSGFRFSLDSLIVKMKKEYNIDMLVKKEGTFMLTKRYIENTKPFYEVYYERPYSALECFLLDGNTGFLLLKIESSTVGDEGLGNSLYDLYIKSLNK